MKTAGDPEGLREGLDQLREEHARLEAEVARLRRATDPAALKARAVALAGVALPLAVLAAYVVRRVFFRWFG